MRSNALFSICGQPCAIKARQFSARAGFTARTVVIIITYVSSNLNALNPNYFCINHRENFTRPGDEIRLRCKARELMNGSAGGVRVILDLIEFFLQL